MIHRGYCVGGRKKTVKLLDKIVKKKKKKSKEKGRSIVRRKNEWSLARDTVQEAEIEELEKSSK